MLTKASCNSASFVFEPMFTLFPEILADTGDIYDGIETFESDSGKLSKDAGIVYAVCSVAILVPKSVKDMTARPGSEEGFPDVESGENMYSYPRVASSVLSNRDANA